MSEVVIRARQQAKAERDAAARSGWMMAAFGLVLMTLLLGSAKLLGDPDTQWHIAAGRMILEAREMPRADALSHTFAGQPWIAKEWLSQIILAATYRIAGWAGVAFLPALATAATFAIVMLVNAGRTSPMTGIAAGLASLAIIAPTVVARPHVLVFPLVALWTLALMRGAENGRPPWIALILMVLWANMHAGFTMGFVIAGAFGLDALLRAAPGSRLRTALVWFAFGIACLLATILTPYGAAPLKLNVIMAQGNEAMQFIDEWRSPGVSVKSLMLLIFSGLSIAALAQRWRVNAARILLLVFLTYAMLRHERFIMVFGLVAPIIAFRDLAAQTGVILKRFNLFQGEVLPPGVYAPAATALALAASAALLLRMPWHPPLNVAPVAALAAVPEDVRQKNVFNSYDLGGFLAFNKVPTFIDGRTDQLFLGGFITRVMRASTAKTPDAFAALLDEFKVEWAIVNTDQWESLHFPKLAGWDEINSSDAEKVRVYRRIAPLGPALSFDDLSLRR